VAANKSFRDLVVWQKAIDLVDEIYLQTGTFPTEENFGLKSQIRRSAVSIPSNIAEGQGRGTPKEFMRFLNIVLGSLAELDTQIEIALRQKMIGMDEGKLIIEQIIEIRKMTYGLINNLKKRIE